MELNEDQRFKLFAASLKCSLFDSLFDTGFLPPIDDPTTPAMRLILELQSVIDDHIQSIEEPPGMELFVRRSANADGTFSTTAKYVPESEWSGPFQFVAGSEPGDEE